MNFVRRGESAIFPRRPRFYNEGRKWYFRTREGAPVGPFSRLSEAVIWAADYVAYIQSAVTLEDVVTDRSAA